MPPIAVMLAIISVLEETKGGPESSFYLPFMGKISFATFQAIMALIVKMELAKIENHYVTFIAPPAGSKGELLLKEMHRVEAIQLPV
jgi:hypothetical protein